MKREIERTGKLPSFRLDVATLEYLIEQLSSLFSPEKTIRLSIRLNLKNEKVYFENIGELREFKSPVARVTLFDISISQEQRHISVSSRPLLGTKPTVSATGDTPAWCAGAIETVKVVASNNRLWYSWFVAWPTSIVLMLALAAPAPIAKVLQPLPPSTAISLLVAWFLPVVLLWALFMGKERFLPSAVLVLDDTQATWRKYVPELSLIAGALSAVLALVQLLLTKP